MNRDWFIDCVAQADRNSRLHAIYAVSYKPTNLAFPLAGLRMLTRFELSTSRVRYTRLKGDLPDGVVQVMFATTDQDGERLSAGLTVKDSQYPYNDERFDANDHVLALKSN